MITDAFRRESAADQNNGAVVDQQPDIVAATTASNKGQAPTI